MRKKILCGLICMVLLAALLSTAVFASTQISSITLKGYKAPEAGKSFQNYLVLTTDEGGIRFYGVDWFDITEDRYLEGNDTFQDGHKYEVQIWVEARSGYNFKCVSDSVPGVTATLDGKQLKVSKAFEYKAFAMVVLSYTFPVVSSQKVVETVDLTVPAPATDAKPSYKQLFGTGWSTLSVEGDRYSQCGFRWSDQDGKAFEFANTRNKFAPDTVYKLELRLKASKGYVFTASTVVTLNGNRLSISLQENDTVIVTAYTFPRTAPQEHTHTPSDWRTTQPYHYKACTTCGDFLEQEDHTGGKATCTEAGTCTVCGYAYLPVTEDHTPDTSKWTACGNLYHAHLCKLCGAHCDTEDHKPGPEATEKAPQKCTVCGFIMAPVKNHTHTLTLVAEVAPGCATTGSSAYYTCSGCNQYFQDAEGKEAISDGKDLTIPAQGHRMSNTRDYDEQNHWYVCAVCKEAMPETKTAHDMKEGKCIACDYDSADVPQTPTQPAAPEKPQPKELSWVTVVILGVVIMGAATVATVFILKSKGKKES